MTNYIENPKTKGSGIVCAIPQKGTCPVKCEDCFFQSGRSYLEPLDQNLPNMPTVKQTQGMIVRMNDGNDSGNKQKLVIAAAKPYTDKFYNTSLPNNLEQFDAPVVLTVNPGVMTDSYMHTLDPPKNLMFVRFRTNPWNLGLGRDVVEYYTSREIPVVLTFMAYYTNSLRKGYEGDFIYRKRTLNSYWVITSKAWDRIVTELGEDNPLVHTCGKNADTFACKHCGNCLREYYATKCKLLTR